MNSVLTNTGAMTALQVLNSTNKALNETQGRISTGLKVATADQNAAIFAMAGVMKADVAGYQQIGEGLGLAESAVSVARSASESISDLLKEMKTKIVAAQDTGIDRTKLQADIDELKGQITSIASSASFNGINYLAGEQDVDILSSLNRSTADGANYEVTSSFISFTKQNLTLGEVNPNAVGTVDAGSVERTVESSVLELDIAFDPDLADLGTLDIAIGGQLYNDTTTGAGAPIALSSAASSSQTDIATYIQTQLDTAFGGDGTGSVVTATVSNGKIRITDTLGRGLTDLDYTAAGDSDFQTAEVINVGHTAQSAVTTEVDYSFDVYKGVSGTDDLIGTDQQYTRVVLTRADGSQLNVSEDSTDTALAALATTLAGSANMTDFATNLAAALNAFDYTDADADAAYDAGEEGTSYTVAWDATSGKLNIQDNQGRGAAARFEGEGAGKLGGLETLDVTTVAGAKQGLVDIETWIQSTLDSASALGSTQKRLGIQRDFLGKLVDNLKTGIGTLVDADMTAESARLQSLQVQQQLGTQALSIANQQPQNILSLFR